MGCAQSAARVHPASPTSPRAAAYADIHHDGGKEGADAKTGGGEQSRKAPHTPALDGLDGVSLGRHVVLRALPSRERRECEIGEERATLTMESPIEAQNPLCSSLLNWKI